MGAQQSRAAAIIRQAGAGSKRTGVYLRAAVSLAIIAGLVWWLSGGALLQAIAAIRPQTWLLVISGFILGHLLSAFKWRLLLGAVGVHIAGPDAVRAHGAGLFANLCLPSVVGGDVIRAALVMRRHQRYEQVALGSLADRVNDTFALMLMAAIAAMLVPAGTELATGTVLGAIALLLTGAVVTLLAVIAWSAAQWPDLPLWLGGFSFGGLIAVQAAASLHPARLVTVAPAVNYLHAGSVDTAGVDWLLIQGDADDVVPAAQVQAWVAGLAHPPVLTLLAGAGHFFHGRLNDLKSAVLENFESV